MAQRVPRTRAGNTWTEARYWSFVRSALRGAWQRYPVKHQFLAKNRREIKGKKRRYESNCAACKKWHVQKEVQVDHIKPAGSLRSYGDLPDFVRRLFCEADNLQIMCKPCHQKKTNQERKDAKEEAARYTAKSVAEGE